MPLRPLWHFGRQIHSVLFGKDHSHLWGVISKIRAKWGMVIMGDTADPKSALWHHSTSVSLLYYNTTTDTLIQNSCHIREYIPDGQKVQCLPCPFQTLPCPRDSCGLEIPAPACVCDMLASWPPCFIPNRLTVILHLPDPGCTTKTAFACFSPIIRDRSLIVEHSVCHSLLWSDDP